jgi:hypothetical protein
MRARYLIFGGTALVFVLSVGIAVGVAASRQPSEADTYQEALNDLAVTGNRLMPKATSVSGVKLTHASTVRGTLVYDYQFSESDRVVDQRTLEAARVSLSASNCSVRVYQELVFERGLALRMRLLDRDGFVLMSRDLKKGDCAIR